MPSLGGQQFSFSSNKSSGLTNMLLVLNLLGIIIIIILLLWGPYGWWGRGVSVSGVDGSVTPGPGGSVIINAACCPGTTTGGDCPGERKKTCEETCKDITGGSPTAYESCLSSKCRPGTTTTCEETCKQKYSTDTASQIKCMLDNCQPGDCKQYCAKVYGSGTAYNNCVNKYCSPPSTGTCRDDCNTRYDSGTTAAQTCIMSECCEESCRERYGTSGHYQECIRTECNPPSQPDCRDSDGNNLGTQGTVVYGTETHQDSCRDTVTVIEWTCGSDGLPHERRETCNTYCDNGICVPQREPTEPDPCEEYCRSIYSSPGMENYYQQCVDQHQCPV